MPSVVRPPRVRADTALLAAVDEARAAAADVGGPQAVGDHVGHRVDGERVLSHLFASTSLGYRGWHWSVTLARAPRQRGVTVDEVALLPGADAVVSPEWLPWARRVQPADVGPGDLVPVDDDDPRLVPGWLAGDPATVGLLDDAAVRQVADEVGLGRERVLSIEGRDAAAERWHHGERGPSSPIARAAPGRCLSCGFCVRMSGPLGLLFGVCANGNVTDDGSVVSLDHGCGGHSDVRVPRRREEARLPEPVIDTVAYEPLVWD